jgi:hypothetical protein
MYRMSFVEMTEIKKQVQGLLDQGVIRPSSSSCGYPIVMVPKKDGTWKMCVNYWALNKIMVKNRYPLLHIKNTHFDSVASVVITRFASVIFCSQVSQVLKKAYCHDAHVVPVKNIKRALGTCQTFSLEEEEMLTRLMNLLPFENTQKTKLLKESAPLYPFWEHWRSPLHCLGAL